MFRAAQTQVHPVTHAQMQAVQTQIVQLQAVRVASVPQAALPAVLLGQRQDND